MHEESLYKKSDGKNKKNLQMYFFNIVGQQVPLMQINLNENFLFLQKDFTTTSYVSQKQRSDIQKISNIYKETILKLASPVKLPQ